MFLHWAYFFCAMAGVSPTIIQFRDSGLTLIPGQYPEPPVRF